MQRCPQPTGFCLSAQKPHTKHSDSCWMHTDTHKQPSEKPSLHCFQTISVQLTRQPGPHTRYLQEGLLCPSVAGAGMGRLRLAGKGAWRCAERRERWEEGPQPLFGPQSSNTCSRDGAQKGWHSYSSKDNGEG